MTVTGHSETIVSADSHVLEPADLWVSRIEARFRDRAPHGERGPNGNAFHFEGRTMPMRAMGTPRAMWGKQIEEGRPGGWDPAVRVKDMATDGISAEVLYPSAAMSFYSTQDWELQDACFRVYNDWLAEFCAASPKKLYGVGLVSLLNPDEGIKELRRIHKRGLRGALVWGAAPGEEYGFGSDRYDRLWAEAEALEMPVSLHSFTGGTGQRNPVFLAFYTVATQPIQESIATLLFAGVFERFPNLKVISVENDIGWVPYLLQRMDLGYERKGPRHAPRFASGRLPSEQFRRNIRCTFMTDPVGLANLGYTGPEVMMWASDYPHDDSTWPDSRGAIEEQFVDCSPAAKRKIVSSNAIDLYKLDV